MLRAFQEKVHSMPGRRDYDDGSGGRGRYPGNLRGRAGRTNAASDGGTKLMEPGDLQILLLCGCAIFVFVLLGIKIGWELRGRFDVYLIDEELRKLSRKQHSFPLPDETKRAAFLRRN
jgi:hypothetical protein